MDWRGRITVDPRVLVGKPVIKGTRIAVEFVVELLGRGWTVEQVHHEYDHKNVTATVIPHSGNGDMTCSR
jgi:uncharacterized protein (DUF433 family)